MLKLGKRSFKVKKRTLKDITFRIKYYKVAATYRHQHEGRENHEASIICFFHYHYNILQHLRFKGMGIFKRK